MHIAWKHKTQPLICQYKKEISISNGIDIDTYNWTRLPVLIKLINNHRMKNINTLHMINL